MATYRDIGDTEVEAGAPLTQPLLQSLSDNQLAITQGAQGAPRVKAAAIELATSQSQTKDTAVWRSLFYPTTTQASTSADQDDLVTEEYYVGRGGNFAVHVVTIGAGGVAVQAKLLKNGSAIQTTTAGTGTVSTWYQLDFAPKDRIVLQLVKPASFVTGQKVIIFLYVNNPLSIGAGDLGFWNSYNTTPIIGHQALPIPDTY